MGTMVGDDGGSNQIGVAPGATWISANGCCPSDAALIASGEWMLAPTDLAGDSPDVTKRPDIINNSWGTQQPTNDIGGCEAVRLQPDHQTGRNRRGRRIDGR